MAERRMFAKTIIDSDAFIDMPTTARLLYYDLGMRADDDGFVNSPKKIMRMIGSSEDDMKILIAKKFIIPFESGVVVIKHWRINNYLRSDRYKETTYKEEKEQLTVKKNGAYSLVGTPMVDQLVDQRYTQDSIGKASIDEESIDKDTKETPSYFHDKEVDDLFAEFLRIRKKLKAENSDIAVKRLVNKILEYSNEDRLTALEIIGQSIENSWKGIFPLKQKQKPKEKTTEELKSIWEEL